MTCIVHRVQIVIIAGLLTSTTIAGVYGQEKPSLIAAGSRVEKLAGGMKFTEGPVWLAAEKKLVFSDIPNSVLMQWSPENGLQQFRRSQNANGNILDHEGRIISCQHSGRNVIRIEKDGTTTVLTDRFDGKRYNSPNDVALHKDGSLWFTDPAWGLTGPHEIEGHWVYRLDPKTGKSRPVIKNLAMPNGIVFSPDYRRVYVADTGGHRKHPDPAFHKLPDGIYCYEITDEGELGKLQFTIDQGSDGMAVDVEGNVYTTHGGHVVIFDAKGRKLQEIDVPEGPANVCFGGPDFQTLFITARTSLYSVRIRFAGATY